MAGPGLDFNHSRDRRKKDTFGYNPQVDFVRTTTPPYQLIVTETSDLGIYKTIFEYDKPFPNNALVKIYPTEKIG